MKNGLLRVALVCSEFDKTAASLGALLTLRKFIDAWRPFAAPAELLAYKLVPDEDARLVVIDLSTRKASEDTIRRLRWKNSQLLRVPRVCLFNGEFDPDYPLQFEGACFIQRQHAIRHIDALLPVLGQRNRVRLTP